MQTQSNKLDFKETKVYAGIDTHKNSWKVTILVDNIFHKTFVQNPQPEVLHAYLLKNFPGAEYHSAYEASYCGFWIHDQFIKLGVKSIVVNPADVPTTDKERKQKEDKRDSRKLAMSLKSGELKGIYIPSRKGQEDRTLVRLRSTLVKDLTRLKNRVKSILYFYGIEIPEIHRSGSKIWSKKFLTWLKAIELTQISGKTSLELMIEQGEQTRQRVYQATVAIRTLSKTEPYKQLVELLTSVPGLGPLSAMILLTEIEDINRFSSEDQFNSFIGLIPMTDSSGDKDKVGNITQRKNAILRSIIVECAWVAIRKDPALLKSYQQLCKRMKPNRAIIRIAKKLSNRIRHVLISNKKYELYTV
jgi:transposase